MLGVCVLTATKTKTILLNLTVAASVILPAFVFTDIKTGFFLLNLRFTSLKLVLSLLLPLCTALFYIAKVKKLRALSAIILLVQPSFVLFTLAFRNYYERYSAYNIYYHYAYGLLAFFAVLFAVISAARRKKISASDFELFYRRFFVGYAFVFIYLFIQLFYLSRLDVSLGTVNLIPFSGEIRLAAANLKYPGVVVHTAGNVLFFSSFSLLLYAFFGGKIKSGAVELLLYIGCPFAVSVLCEISQYITTAGNADVDDVILNILGAAIGFFAVRFIKKSFSED